ncbi:MAG: excinuclease ATPase subunit [Lachnospiraceae bacterium]|nr:excinuclease ATPase subunit [Lachnospiraceae bacterium]
MTWGALYMYYHCPKCGLKFEYALDVMPEFGDQFGCCPECRVPGIYEKEGARQLDDNEYFEVE